MSLAIISVFRQYNGRHLYQDCPTHGPRATMRPADLIWPAPRSKLIENYSASI